MRGKSSTSHFVLSLAVISLASLLFSTAPAAAATVSDERPLLFSFDGGDSSIGGFTLPFALATNEASGDVYVINGAGSGQGPTGYGPGPSEWDDERVLCKFDAEGNALDFTAGSSAGRSCLDGKDTPAGAFGVNGFFGVGAFTSDVAIDNSSVNPGRIYLHEAGGPILAFNPDGSYLWTLPLTTAKPCGIAIDREGHLWVGNGDASGEAGTKALEFAATGSPPAQIGSVTMTHGASKRPCRLAISESGNELYVSLRAGSESSFDKYVGGAYHSTFGSSNPFASVTVDQSKATGHIFGTGLNLDNFLEYEPCSTLGCAGVAIAGSPFGRDLLGLSYGIAYSPSKDWVYLSDDASSTVKVFGPITSGTVPDVSTEASTEVALHTATAHGTINPQSLPNSYHFEWKLGTGASWGAAKSSPPQSIEPTDGNPHSVSLPLSGLKSNATYQVRLVGTNTENDLHSYATPDTFSTPVPPAPVVSIDAINSIDTDSAHVEATIDPIAEETQWEVEKSIDPTCASGFTAEPTQTIPEGEAGSVEVEWDLEGLLPAQHYCVRITATGPGGTDVSSVEEFITDAIPPSDAGAAFAAPRTDTSARINARVNPEGEADLSYRFEWSEDGTDWTQLPIHTSTIATRQQIIVADELSDLKPATTYHYRLALAENEAGSAPSLGEEKTFTTRTSAEMTIPPDAFGNPRRGIELVNNPDKGNQNVFALGPTVGSSPISSDGEEAFWEVPGGAPGANNGTANTFLAERTETGWHSESLAPPPGQQYGGGDYVHKFSAATPDFQTVIMNASYPTVGSTPEPPTFLRRHRGGPEEFLKTYLQQQTSSYATRLELSDDGEHVLFIAAETKQLEDIGDGSAETISLMPDGLPSACGLHLEGDSFTRGGGKAAGLQWRPGYFRIANGDGASRVYFQVPPNGNCNGLYGLYVRNRETATTTLIDPGALGKDPELIRVTPDGREAYFVTHSSLDPADANSHADVYRWEEAEGASVCLSCEVPDAEVTGDVLVSDDFSHIYFQSKKRLITGLGEAGETNFYVLDGEELGFVASVKVKVGGEGLDNIETGLSADGETLLFKALATPALTADPVAAQCVSPTSSNGEKSPCMQVYRYEAADESIECISCRQGETTTHMVGSPTSQERSDFSLSGDGQTVAFITQERLVHLDVNGDTDIYEWRNGATRLITDGLSDFQTGFAAPQVRAIDADGSDVLFVLVPPSGSLTGFEQDELLNLYDARIGGGFEPPSPVVHCIEDSCQGPLVPPPVPGQSGSAGYSGYGNLAKPKKSRKPCAKKRGKAKRRCVARQRKNRESQAKQRRAK